jgi:hypothetical protein
LCSLEIPLSAIAHLEIDDDLEENWNLIQSLQLESVVAEAFSGRLA